MGGASPNDLSIEGGELTANLKLKRHEVEARFHGVIERCTRSIRRPRPGSRSACGGRVVSLRLRALEFHVPDVVARSALRRLFDATASAFGCEPEDVSGLDRRALLERYASFTTRCAEQALADSRISTPCPAACGRSAHAGRVAPPPARRPHPSRSAAGRPDRVPDDRHRPPGGPSAAA